LPTASLKVSLAVICIARLGFPSQKKIREWNAEESGNKAEEKTEAHIWREGKVNSSGKVRSPQGTCHGTRSNSSSPSTERLLSAPSNDGARKFICQATRVI